MEENDGKCMFCHDNTDEILFPTLCGCNGLYLHLSCAKPVRQRFICPQCNRRYNGELYYKLANDLINNRSRLPQHIEPIHDPGENLPQTFRQLRDPPRSCWKNNKITIIVTLIIVALIVNYIIVGWYLVRRGYTIPMRIKKNQVLIMCIANDIGYVEVNAFIRNNTIVSEFGVSYAYNDKKHNIANVFKEYTCTTGKCPEQLTSLCWNYKDYYSLRSKDIEKKFNDIYILWFVFGWFGSVLIPLIIAATQDCH